MSANTTEKEVEIVEDKYRRLIRQALKFKEKNRIRHASGIAYEGHIPGEKIKIEERYEKQIVEKRENKYIDFAFLYSSPLVTLPPGNPNPKPVEDPPLGFELEYKKIKDIIRKHGIEFLISKHHATYKQLSEIISARARILHISCHGTYN